MTIAEIFTRLRADLARYRRARKLRRRKRELLASYTAHRARVERDREAMRRALRNAGARGPEMSWERAS